MFASPESNKKDKTENVKDNESDTSQLSETSDIEPMDDEDLECDDGQEAL